MEKHSRSFDPVNDDRHWKILFDTHFHDLQSLNAISSLWISGLSKLGIDHNVRPTAAQLTDALQAYTKYTFIQTNQNIILPQHEWYQMIANYEMPFTSFVRRPEELKYCDEPDIFHDIMGHVPFLAEQEYSDMYQLLANTYLKAYHQDQKEALKKLDFIGGMLIELGLVQETSGVKAFGATFYSSSEVFEAYKTENQIPFTNASLLSGESYDRHSFQGKYYIFDSLEQLTNIIIEINSSL